MISAPVRVEVPSTPASAIPERTATAAILAPSAGDGESSEPNPHGLQSLDIEKVHPNPRQPRQHFDDAALKALAESIASSGLMQPIVVRRAALTAVGRGGFQIIAGERRWRAAKIAGLTRIPALVRDVDERTAAELSLIENIQREDLNPMERADAFRRLIDDFNLTHEQIAHRVGLDRSSISNLLRLQELDEFCKTAVRAGELSLGHAKALLAIANNKQRAGLAQRSVREGWSVRELERRVKAVQGGRVTTSEAAPPKSPAALHTADLERRLAEHLGTKVRLEIGRNKGAGRLIIDFFSLDQFDGLLRQMQFESD